MGIVCQQHQSPSLILLPKTIYQSWVLHHRIWLQASELERSMNPQYTASVFLRDHGVDQECNGCDLSLMISLKWTRLAGISRIILIVTLTMQLCNGLLPSRQEGSEHLFGGANKL